MSSASLASLIRRVEAELMASYAIPLELSAADHLVDTPEAAEAARLGQNRAVTLLRQTPGDDAVQIGLYFHPDARSCIENQNPVHELTHENLDSFCMLVEEISHFHLLCQRATQNRAVTQLELEWQGEVDKWLMAVCFLEKQTGHPHLAPLSRLIFDSSVCYSETAAQRYDEAHRLAARYCFKLLDVIEGNPRRIRSRLLKEACRSTYDLHWADKLRKIQSY